MKKFSAAFIAFIVLIVLSINSFAQPLTLIYDGSVHNYTGANYSIKVNGERVEAEIPAVIINDRSLVPARAIFEKLGATVLWDAAAQKVSVSLNGINIELKINSSQALVNNKAVILDTPAKIINDRTTVPIRFVGEQLNMKVGWLPEQSLITIDNAASTGAGSLKDIKYSINKNVCEVQINLDSYQNYKTMTLSNPDRIVIDIPNIKSTEKHQIINVNSTSVKAIRYAQLDADTAKQAKLASDTLRVVLDVIGNPKFEVVERTGQLAIATTGSSLVVSRGDLDRRTQPGSNELAVEHFVKSDYDEIVMSVNEYKNYNIIQLADKNQIVVDIPNAIVPGQQQRESVNSGIVQSISYTQTENNSATVVIDLEGQPQYQVIEEIGRLILRITPGSDNNIKQDSRPQSPDNSQTSGDKQPTNTDLNIKYSQQGGFDDIAISINSYKGYYVSTIKQPNRIVIDIPYSNGPRGEQKIDVNSKLTQSVRYAQYTKDILRVVADVKGIPEYEVLEQNGQLVMRVKNCKYKNLDYQNTGDRVCLILDGAKLTAGGNKLSTSYTEKYDTSGKKYTITFKNNLADLDNEFMKINDALMDSIEIIRDSQQTSIVFNAKDKFLYNVFTRPEVNNTAITILKPASKADKLVVIDPGHGGAETGAIYSNLYEKDLNLDIALRLNALLKSKNIKTYIIRENDSFVGLYERAYIANNLNASLFLSIHNNAYYASSKGTETLYYTPDSSSTGFTSKKLAQLIQTSLVSTLSTFDRKIVSRPNLVVLKATTMPAALAEIAFMTNSEDRANLQKEEFKQKAASTLCDSIIKALDEIK